MKIEVSIGEVVDKITILQIKEEKIKDLSKLKYVKEELIILEEALRSEGAIVADSLIQELKKINQELWDAEDVLRLKEKKQEFDADYIANARLDAKLNDMRFLVKNKINNQCESLVKEQKSYDGLYSTD
jgi:hypothetical protein